MKKGKVKFFNDTKGFGFINDHETGNEVFVHKTGLRESVKQGDEVSFDMEKGKKGITAVNVKRS